MSEKQLYALVQNDENDELRQEARYYRETSRRRLWKYAILAQVALLAVYSGLAMGYVRHTLKENAPDIHGTQLKQYSLDPQTNLLDSICRPGCGL